MNYIGIPFRFVVWLFLWSLLGPLEIISQLFKTSMFEDLAIEAFRKSWQWVKP